MMILFINQTQTQTAVWPECSHYPVCSREGVAFAKNRAHRYLIWVSNARLAEFSVFSCISIALFCLFWLVRVACGHVKRNMFEFSTSMWYLFQQELTTHSESFIPYFGTYICYTFRQYHKFTIHDVIQSWVRVSSHDNLKISRKRKTTSLKSSQIYSRTHL